MLITNVNIGSTPLCVHLRLVCVPQPVILKELKQTDGDFSEDQRIELNTVRHLPIKSVNSIFESPFMHLSLFPSVRFLIF